MQSESVAAPQGPTLHLVPTGYSEESLLRSALREARTALARLSGIVDSVADAVFTTTLDGTVTSWNRGAEELYGYPRVDMLGADLSQLHPPGSDEPRRVLAMARRGDSVRGLETVRRTRAGQMCEVSMDLAPLRADDGEVSGMVVIARDITDRRELEAELVRRTMHDELTGLPNRSYLTYRLTQSLLEARRSDRPVTVLMVGLDQFKAVNDVYGHLVGDQVLARVAERLRALLRPIDLVARIGGDEFVLVCPDTNVAAAEQLAEQVMTAVRAPIAVERRLLRIGASVGIAVTPPLESDAEQLLKHADAAKDEAKARGRSRSQLSDPTLVRRAGEQRRLAGELREALAHDLLELHYQPVVDLRSDRVVGLEALARWRHPDLGMVPPGEFVPLAEVHGFAAELDRWVLTHATRAVATLRDSGALPTDVTVAVNLSARSLDDPGLVPVVAEVTRRSGLPTSALVLEVTETALLQNREVARDTLDRLRSLGAGIALDDFGTGYSSLSFLRELPVTVVKIDRSFVRDAAHRPEDLAITEAIVRLAHALGLETVAEGIETADQRDLLRRLGCTSAQGFWWSPAVPITDLALVVPHRPASTSGASVTPLRRDRL